MNTGKCVRQAIVLPLFFALILLPLAASGGGESEEQTRMREVTLYTNGTSLVTYQRLVSGSGSFELEISDDDMLDVLKTMIVRDLDGGSIVSAGFASQDPLNKSLSELSINTGSNPGIGNLLSANIGSSVRLNTGDSVYRGIVMGTERRESADGQRQHVDLLVQGRVTSIAVADISSLEFTNADEQADLERALELIEADGNSGRSAVRIEYRGEGERRVLISYLRAAPVWKPSYRLISSQAGTHLQGWAVIENTSGSDWNDVALRLSTANPVSFIMDLYTPLYVQRPSLQLPGGQVAAVPDALPNVARARAYESADEAILGMAAPMAERSQAFADDDFSSAVQSAHSAATGQSSGNLARVFEYLISEPVDLMAAHSAMVPIYNGQIESESYLTWRSDSSNPVYRAVELTNDSDAFLSAGPMAIYDDASFAGEAVLGFMAPGSTSRLEYAVEDAVDVQRSTGRETSELFEIRASGGVLQTRTRRVRDVEYLVENNGADTQVLHLFHRKTAGFEVLNSPAFEESGAYAEFNIDLEAAGRSVLAFSESMEVSRSYQLFDLRDNNIELFIASGLLSDQQISTLQELSLLRTEKSETERNIGQLYARISRIYSDQERIVRNMESLENGSSLYQRYLGNLEAQEDELEQLQIDIARLEQLQREQEDQLQAFIASIEL